MIARACYVQCDRCGDPAEVVTDGAAKAREAARRQGFKRISIDQGLRHEDVCSRCLRAAELKEGQ